jgi:F0F1-type ATP synthase assembly protein I
MSNEPELPPLPSDDELNARFDKLREGFKTDVTNIDDKLEGILEETKVKFDATEADDAVQGKLDEIEARTRAARHNLEKAKGRTDSITGSLDIKTSRSTGYGLMYAYALAGGPMLGFGVGLLINRFTGTQGWQIWLTLFGAAFGLWWVVRDSSTRNA